MKITLQIELTKREYLRLCEKTTAMAVEDKSMTVAKVLAFIVKAELRNKVNMKGIV